jgi:hypothetical protein
MKTLIFVLLFAPLLMMGQTNQYFKLVDSIYHISSDPEKLSHAVIPGFKHEMAKPTSCEYQKAFLTPDYKNDHLYIGDWKPNNSITFCGNTNGRFTITFKGDSLICSGDLKPDEGAKLFIDFCRKQFKTKIDSLDDQVRSFKIRSMKDSIALVSCREWLDLQTDARIKANRELESNRDLYLKTLKKIQRTK